MPSSRLVAESFKRAPSVWMRILDRMGKVAFELSAWLTTESPWARSFCWQVIFILVCFLSQLLPGQFLGSTESNLPFQLKVYAFPASRTTTICRRSLVVSSLSSLARIGHQAHPISRAREEGRSPLVCPSNDVDQSDFPHFCDEPSFVKPRTRASTHAKGRPGRAPGTVFSSGPPPRCCPPPG